MVQPITVLNVAEKPSVARALAEAFGRMPNSRERPMRREAAQIFTHEQVSFPNVFSQGNGHFMHGPMALHTMTTTSVRGHLASQDFGPEYGWSRCDPVALFEAPLETTYRDDMHPLERMLSQLARQVRAVILWLDCDREGEAISDEVREVCLRANPRLSILRAKFSTVLASDLQKALQCLGRITESFVHAVQARSELDLRVGAAFTRFQTLRLQKKFQGISGSVVSYGPCQFPTLGFVVERWARIQTFVPENFWFLELTLGRDDNNAARPIVFTWKRQRLFDRICALVLYEACLEESEAVVLNLGGRNKNKWRPVPLATVELQKRASRFLHIGSETLMTAAEELYQHGYISYPRTETERFHPDFQHRPLIQQFAECGGELGAYAAKLLTENHFQLPRAGPNDDKAHPPISPCKAVDPNSIGDATQRNIYRLVVKHYLACCSRDAVGRETELTLRIATEDFTAKGLMVLERNWLEIYHPWERWSTGQGELPPLQVGSRVVPRSFLLKEGQTKAPEPISEVELISLMDRNKIGTDATIATHITTIQDRLYATKDANQKFHPTPLGIALVEGYNSMGYQLNKPDLRREMEHECNLVANAQKSKQEIMGPILEKMRQCFITASAEVQKLDEAMARRFPRIGANNETTHVLQANFSECGTCQGRMALKQEREAGRNNRTPRKLLFCTSCSMGYTLPRGQVRPKTENGNAVKCPICNFQVLRIERGDGYEGNGYHVCPKCFSDPPPDHGGNGSDFRCFACQHPTCSLAGGLQGGEEVFPCPFCAERRGTGKVMLRKNSCAYVLSCSNYNNPERCNYTIWLPRESQKVSVVNDHTCPTCSTGNRVVKKLSFTWKPGSVPPYLGRECEVCILCDSAFRQDLQVALPQMNQVTIHARDRTTGRGGGRAGRGNATGGGRAGRGNATGRGNGGRAGRGNATGGGRAGRGNANGGRGGRAGSGNANGGRVAGGICCYKCGQPGHYANACPQNNVQPNRRM